MSFDLYHKIAKTKIPTLQKYVLQTLALAANKDNQAWPSAQTIADMISSNKRQVFRELKKLEEQGWIKKEQRFFSKNKKKRSTLYTIITEKLPSTGDSQSPVHEGTGDSQSSLRVTDSHHQTPERVTDSHHLIERNKYYKERGGKTEKSPPPIDKKINGFFDNSEEQKRIDRSLSIILGKGVLYEN